MNKCGCGRDLRYSHYKDDIEVMSCNKHYVCLTYEEQSKKINMLMSQSHNRKVYIVSDLEDNNNYILGIFDKEDIAESVAYKIRNGGYETLRGFYKGCASVSSYVVESVPNVVLAFEALRNELK